MKKGGLVLAGVVGLFVLLAAWLFLKARQQTEAGAVGGSIDPSQRDALIGRGLLPDGGTIGKTIADRHVRDELRRRILQAWAQGEGESAAAAREGRFVPAPNCDGECAMDPDYIQQVVREDLFPMAQGCYEDMLKRRPDAGGRIDMWFEIVGDEKLGGLVEEASVDAGGPLDDRELRTCIRESVMSLAFRPPANGGRVTVGYPIEFAPGDEGDD